MPLALRWAVSSLSFALTGIPSLAEPLPPNTDWGPSAPEVGPVGALAPVSSAPRVTVEFPLSGALTEASAIVVRGRAVDPDGIAGLWVEGVPATSTDEFAHWRAEVPLILGRQTLHVAASDRLGHHDPFSASVNLDASGPLLVAARAVARGERRVFIADASARRVLAVDPSTGLRTEVSSDAVGSGRRFFAPIGLALAPDESTLWVSEPQSLVRVQVTSGARVLASGPTVGSGLPLSTPRDLVVDALAQRVLLLDDVAGENALLAVDMSNGDRTLLSGVGHGSGPAFSAIAGLALDAAARRAYTVDGDARSLIAIDLMTGDRSVLSDASIGAGPNLSAAAAVVPEPLGGRVLVLTDTSGDVVAVSLATGDRTHLGNAGLARRTDFGSAFDMGYAGACLAPDGAALETCWADALGSLDLASGVESIVTASRRGSGPLPEYAVDLLLERERGVLAAWISSPCDLRLAEIDVASGARTAVSVPATVAPPCDAHGLAHDPASQAFYFVRWPAGGPVVATFDPHTGLGGDVTGSLPFADVPRKIAFDPATRTTFVAGNVGIYAHGAASNAWRQVSGPEVGPGPRFSSVASFALALDLGAAFVLDPLTYEVFRVELASGARSVIAAPRVGYGFALGTPNLVAYDSGSRRLLVTDVAWSALVAIDLATLERTVVTKCPSHALFDSHGELVRDRGRGPAFSAPASIAVDAERGLAFVADGSLASSVLAIDLDSGDRVLVAH